MILSRILAASAAAALLSSPAAFAQESSYTPGTVWQFNEFQKKEGVVVSYHILAVNNPRNGEPDLVLAVEFKDYVPTAQQLEMQKKIEGMLGEDTHKADTASGERKPMRKLVGGMQLQELKLK